MCHVFYPPSQRIIYSRDFIFFVDQSYYKAEDDEVFDTERNSVLASEYEDEGNPSQKKFYNILLQQTRDDTKERFPANED